MNFIYIVNRCFSSALPSFSSFRPVCRRPSSILHPCPIVPSPSPNSSLHRPRICLFTVPEFVPSPSASHTSLSSLFLFLPHLFPYLSSSIFSLISLFHYSSCHDSVPFAFHPTELTRCHICYNHQP